MSKSEKAAGFGKRRSRELRTITLMMRIYCRAHHSTRDELCDECAELLAYSAKRLAACPFKVYKPSCKMCKIHCYQAARRAQIRRVMRYAGPRMLLRNPYLALAHLANGFRHL
jgi:hypothetical protein